MEESMLDTLTAFEMKIPAKQESVEPAFIFIRSLHQRFYSISKE